MLASNIFNYSITQQNFGVGTQEGLTDAVKDYKVDWDNLTVDKKGNWKIFDGKGGDILSNKASQNNTLKEAMDNDPNKIVQFLVDRLKSDTALTADQKQRYMQTIVGNYRRTGGNLPITVTDLGKDNNGNTIQYKWDESKGSGTVSTGEAKTDGTTSVEKTEDTPQQTNTDTAVSDAALQQLLGRFIDTGFGVTRDANGAITGLAGSGNNEDNMKLYNALTPEQKEQFNKVLESRGTADNNVFKRAFAWGNKDEKNRIAAIENVNKDWLTNTGVRTTNQWTADAIQNAGYNKVATGASRTSIDLPQSNEPSTANANENATTTTTNNPWGTKDDVAKLVNDYAGTGGWYANVQARGSDKDKERAEIARDMLNGNKAYLGTEDRGIQKLGDQKIIDDYNAWKNTKNQPIPVQNPTTNNQAPVENKQQANTNMEK